MERRRFGRTGHESSVAIFGAAAFWEVSRADVEATMERVLEAGVNHIDVGTMIIKSIARGPWGEHDASRTTWYRPFEAPADIQRAVDFVLSHEVTGICIPGDTGLLPVVLDACERHAPMDAVTRQELIIEGASRYEPLFA